MKWRIAFSFLIITSITFVSGLAMASPAGMHTIHNLGKPKITVYMSPSGEYTCGLNELAWVYCWGSNVSGQFGNGTTIGSIKPIPIRSGVFQLDTARTQAASMSGTTYIITNTGVLMSWGDNIYGKLGTGASGGASFTPQIVDPGVRYMFIESQYRTSCGITVNNVLKCWGYNADGEVGDNSTMQRNTPVIIDAGVNYKTVAVGGYSTCAITTGGILKCWGLNDNNQIGDGTSTTRYLPVVIDSPTTYQAVSVGLTHACAITTSGIMKCWGDDTSGQIGDGGLSFARTTPYAIDTGTIYTQISSADDSNCALTTAGTLKCWGANNVGQLGNGNTSNQVSPQVIDAANSYLTVSTGGQHTCGITNTKITKCWGQNDVGQLGIGNMINQSLPQVAAP